MANIKSAIKRARQAKANNLRNRACKSMMQDKRKTVLAAIAAGNKDEAQKAYRAYSSALDRSAKKGVIVKNTASRKKSRMAVAVGKMA